MLIFSYKANIFTILSLFWTHAFLDFPNFYFYYVFNSMDTMQPSKDS